ncbi:DNA-binding transcriptional MerR regulator [Aneurinibacillus soli]|uniref:HTH-type transcriptional regulator YfmP n=1 Tax=Aneurinibacillus soli TaxID=1500254 RepID=A0A0U5AZX5_9BACL|nr:MerR family transcriptional regulator [Aneurinibacillus soli]PYE59693.1 DNA-binding transcriptional MerR regulator [Aneurinibacillus soli]BAU29306.1 HTH-type transcriptional regulator YfmP [Aneurinibacillus soli]
MDYKIEDAARKTGLTKRALRYYEELGLITPFTRSDGGYRMYTDADIEQIMHVKNLRDLLGVSLSEIKEYVDLEQRAAALRTVYFNKKDQKKAEESLHFLTQLETTIRKQQMLLRQKIDSMQQILETYEEKLTRIHLKKQELESLTRRE